MNGEISANNDTTAEPIENIVRLALTRGVGTRLYRKLVAAFGSAGAVARASIRQLKAVDGVGDAVAEAIASGSDAEAAEQLELADQLGAEIIPVDSPDYPANLRNIYDPPLVLYVWGDLRATEEAVAIVGARRPTYYGRQQAEKLAGGLAFAGWTIVAGLARGLDSCAHEGALAAGGRTVAVLGSGLLRIYPRENSRLAEQITESGAVISEFPMEAKADPWNFPRRNRIISGLSRGVIIVEAAAGSGSLITASWATEQNRVVFALPGRVDNPLSEGCHGLIRDGAVLVRSVDDVLDELGSPLTHRPEQEQPPVVPADLSEPEARLMALLERDPKHIDDLIGESGMSAAEVSSSLLMLEIKKVAVQLPGKQFVLA